MHFPIFEDRPVILNLGGHDPQGGRLIFFREGTKGLIRIVKLSKTVLSYYVVLYYRIIQRSA